MSGRARGGEGESAGVARALSRRGDATGVIAPAESVRTALSELLVDEYDDAVVYGGPDGETVLHEGAVSVRPSGWLELPTGRLLSPSAVHHVDTYGDR